MSGTYDDDLMRYRAEAEQGNPSAQYLMGRMYCIGKEVPQDFAEAFRWFLKAAENGSAFAQYEIGYAYNGGGDLRVLPPDYAKAVYWYTKAAEQGNVNAQHSLGLIYAYGGDGPPQDRIEALRWFRMAAAQGHRATHRFFEMKTGKFNPDGQEDRDLWLKAFAEWERRDAAEVEERKKNSGWRSLLPWFHGL